MVMRPEETYRCSKVLVDKESCGESDVGGLLAKHQHADGGW